MDVRFILQAIPDAKKKLLAARRVAQIPQLTMSQALSKMDHLPVTLFGRLSYDHAALLAKDLEALGCRVHMEPLDAEPTAKSQPRQEPPAAPKPLETPPRAPSKPYVRPMPEPAVKKAALASPQGGLRIPRQWLWAGAAVAGLGLILWLLSGSLAGGKNRRLNAQIRDAEKQIEMDPANTAAVEQAVAAYTLMAQSKKPPACRIELLSRAVRLRSDEPMLRSMLAHAYSDSASRIVSQDARIRFFRIAIGFNKYNEQAWDGLITAYENAKQPAAAQDTRLRKIALFGAPREGLDQVLRAYGQPLHAPAVRNDTLFVAYQSRKENREAILHEAYIFCQDIRPLHPAQQARIEVFSGARRMLVATTPLQTLPDDFLLWQERAKIR